MMSVTLIPSPFRGNALRLVTVDNEAWFLASDIAVALNRTRADALDLVALLPPGEHCSINYPGPDADVLLEAINERGVFRLLTLVEALQPGFQDWFVHHAVPCVRGARRNARARSIEEAGAVFVSWLDIAEATNGYNQNLALLSANQATLQETGIDVLNVFGLVHLVAPRPEAHFSVTEIGRLIGLSPRETNQVLEARGLQIACRDYRARLIWDLTEAGKAYGVRSDTGKRQRSGTAVTQLRWYSSVVDVLTRKDS